MSNSLWPCRYTAHGILQARILEWVPVSFSKGSSQPRKWTQVSCIAGRFFTTREARALFGSKIDFPSLANTFLIYLESWKESKYRCLKVLTRKPMPARWLSGKEPTCQCRFTPWVGKISRRRKWPTHSSIRAWKIPWTEEPGGLQSMGWQRVGHNWATKQPFLKFLM